MWVPDWTDSSEKNTAGRVTVFTRHVFLKTAATNAVLHCSADTRYKLYVNGTRVAVGPSRGSPFIWYYDSLDISSFLRQGDNELRFIVVRYFSANRAAMPFGRTSFPGLTVFGTVNAGEDLIELRSGEVKEWKAEVNESIEFPTGSVDDVFLHVSIL